MDNYASLPQDGKPSGLTAAIALGYYTVLGVVSVMAVAVLMVVEGVRSLTRLFR